MKLSHEFYFNEHNINQITRLVHIKTATYVLSLWKDYAEETSLEKVWWWKWNQGVVRLAWTIVAWIRNTSKDVFHCKSCFHLLQKCVQTHTLVETLKDLIMLCSQDNLRKQDFYKLGTLDGSTRFITFALIVNTFDIVTINQKAMWNIKRGC